MKKVRFGVAGVGNMGMSHARNCAENGGRDFCLTAVCDVVEKSAKKAGKEFGVAHFTNAQEMFDSSLCDAVIISMPHYFHAPLTIRAARAGLHVLCEKPLASTVGPARAMVAECKKRRRALGVLLQQRTRTIMIKMKKLVESGQIGEVFRVQMTCSNWFRTQDYYDSGAWRGTWSGEGGGVLINQAPHHLDLFQWIGGMPKRVMGMVGTRAHKIEVEDTANFICDYGNGKIGYLYATTAEEPGYEQFMVCGDKGTLVCEGGKLKLAKLKMPITEHINCDAKKQKVTWREIPLAKDPGGKHLTIIRNFAAHILRGTEMYVDGKEGLKELELSNAMYLAGFNNKTVSLPVDATEMERLITRLERKHSKAKTDSMRKAANRDLKKLLK